MVKRTLKDSTKTGKISRGEIKAVIAAVHVVPRSDNGWEVRKSGNGRLIQLFTEEKEALEFAREVSRRGGSELIVHGRDGKIKRSNSYRTDPIPQ